MATHLGSLALRTPLGFQKHGTQQKQGQRSTRVKRQKKDPAMANKGWGAEAYTFRKLRQGPSPCYSDPFISLCPKLRHFAIRKSFFVAQVLLTTPSLKIPFGQVIFKDCPPLPSPPFGLFPWVLSWSLSARAKSYSFLPALTLQSHGTLCIYMFPTAIKTFHFDVSNSLLSPKILLVCSVILFWGSMTQ